MKRVNILVFSILALILFSAPFILANNENNPLNDKSLLQLILDKLGKILETLDIIAEKETNVEVNVEPNIIVEPTPITIEGGNSMLKRGNIILKEPDFDYEFECNGQPYNCIKHYFKKELDSPFNVALPNGVCKLAISTDSQAYTIYEMKDVPINARTSYSCSGQCIVNVNVDDEYFFIRIQLATGHANERYSHMSLAYNCE